MFRGRKSGKESSANKPGKESKPNELSWAADEAPDADEDDAALEDELDEDLDEEVDAEFADDESEDDEAEIEVAERQLELQRELERQAEEFGLLNQSPAAVYGDNGEAVLDVLDKLEAIDVDAAERLADAWMAIDPADLDVVEREMRRVHRGGDHYYELAAAESAVTTWLGTREAAEPDDADLWRIVAEAARAAVDALVLDRDLDDADYETLYGAWGDVMDAEEEPEPAPRARGKAGTKAPAGAKGSAAKGPAAKGPAAKGATTKPDAGGKGSTAKSGKAAAAEPVEDEFGPNTELVRTFFGKLETLVLADLQELVAAWKGQDRHDLKQAHEAVKRLAKEDETWREQVRAAQETVTEWAERIGGTATTSPNAAIAGGASAITLVAADLIDSGAGARKRREAEQLLEARQGATPAAVDAVTALVLADLLEPEDAETLFAPWADAIGEPDLPEYESEE